MRSSLPLLSTGLALVALGVIGAAQAPSAPPPVVLAARPAPHDARMNQIILAISPARIKEEDNRLIAFGTRSSLTDYKPGPEGSPGATTESTATRGVVPAREWIREQFQAISDANGGRLKVSIDTFAIPKAGRIPDDQTMGNVVAVLPGTDPNDHRVFVVSGHYDSIPGSPFTADAPGANDDASGTIVSMECARALAKYEFPATIEFLAVEGEEQGLDGSKHEADVAKAAGADIPAMLNNDIVGGDQTPGQRNTDTLRVYSVGVPRNSTPQELARIVANAFENDSPSREIARYASEVAGMYLPNFHVVLEYRPDRFQRGGDQESFENDGFPSVRFTELHENANHQHQVVRTENGIQYGDLGEWISQTYIANVARVDALTLASLASSPLPPAAVYFRGGQSIGTPITWTAAAGAVSYRVLLRPTSSNQWTMRIPAPAVAAPVNPNAPPAADGAPPAPSMYQVTIPQSPDNYVIAMVSVDKAGHESLPALATAAPRGRGRGRGPGGRGPGGTRGGIGGGGQQ